MVAETDQYKNPQSSLALSVTASAYYTVFSTHTVRNIVDKPARFIIRLLFVSDLFLILYSIFVKQNQNKTNTETAMLSKIWMDGCALRSVGEPIAVTAGIN